MSPQGINVLSLEHPFSLMIIMATAICPTLLHLDGPWPCLQRLYNLDKLNTMDLCLKQYFLALHY